MKVVAFATIKMNSQRVPHKNVQMVGSKPLCYHILNTAKQIREIDKVIVYCSNPEISKYIPEDVYFLQRDKYLDGDEIVAKDTYSAFLHDIEAEYYIALCTTSPFTRVESIENALQKVLSGEYDSAFSAKREQTFAWYRGSPINYDPGAVPRTQELDPVFIETSAFFIFRRELWMQHGRRIGFHPYIQEVDSVEAIDIDTPDDMFFAKQIAENVVRI